MIANFYTNFDARPDDNSPGKWYVNAYTPDVAERTGGLLRETLFDDLTKMQADTIVALLNMAVKTDAEGIEPSKFDVFERTDPTPTYSCADLVELVLGIKLKEKEELTEETAARNLLRIFVESGGARAIPEITRGMTLQQRREFSLFMGFWIGSQKDLDPIECQAIITAMRHVHVD